MLSRKIFIQQDGAKDHVSCNDKLFNDALVDNGINATLYTQAVNTPYVNLLDLSFFGAIQSFNDTAPKNEEELIEAVSVAYDMYPYHKINQTWLTLQCCFNLIVMHHGDNNYNIDHIGKEQLEQNRNLPNVMDVVEDAANICNYNNTDDDKATTTTWMMKTPLPKTKRIPILPTHKWEDGGYRQRLSHRCRSRNRCCCCCFMHEFSPNLGEWVCVFGACVLFSGIF